MKHKPFYRIVLAMYTVLAFCVSAKAQEEKSYSEGEIVTRDARIDLDPITLAEGEPTPDKNTITVAIKPDSLIVRPVKPIIKSTDKVEEDPLSFNFLYYIIEKFKLSDIIE